MAAAAGAQTAETAQPEITSEDIDLISSLDVGDAGDGKAADGSEAAASEGKSSDKDGAEDSEWFSAIEDESLRNIAVSFDNRDDLLSAITNIQKSLGVESMEDWRQSISDEKLREYADRTFSSPVDAVKGHFELRQKLSSALVPPGKDASKEDREAFAGRLSKMLGVPEKPEDYSFPAPLEGTELTDAEKASQEGWAKFFHEHHLPKSMADAIITRFVEESEAGNVALQKADDRFAEATEAELKGEWGDDYETNRTLASRAAKELFGNDLEDVMQAKMSDNRLLMDSPFMLRGLARIGREMSEGSMEILTENERETLDDQVKDLRKRADEAKNKGETRLANKLFQEEQALLSKLVGNRPIIGDGRNA